MRRDKAEEAVDRLHKLYKEMEGTNDQFDLDFEAGGLTSRPAEGSGENAVDDGT